MKRVVPPIGSTLIPLMYKAICNQQHQNEQFLSFQSDTSNWFYTTKLQQEITLHLPDKLDSIEKGQVFVL